MSAMRRLLACLLVALAGVLALAQKETVLVWGVNFGPETKGLEAVVREFERRNPELRVRVFNMGAGGMNPQKTMTSIVGNVAPDVISQDRFTLSDWAQRGAFRPLDDLIERDRADLLAPRKEDYYAAPWQEAMFGGKVYGIPTGSDNRILYWNKKLFREAAAKLRAAGLDPERAPRTWSELIAYGKALTIKNKDGSFKQVGFIPNWGNTWLYMYAFQNNAAFMSPDGRKCTLDSPEAVEALQFMVDGYKQITGGYEAAKAFESGFQTNENDAFVVGKVAMKIDGDWSLNSLSRYAPEMELGTAPPPVPDDRYYRRGRFKDEKSQFVTWSGGFSYGIPRGARNVEGGWRFIKFLTSTEGRMIAADAQAKWERRRGRSFVPAIQANRQASELMFERHKPAEKKFADALRLHIDLMDHARIRPVTFVGQPLWDAHVRAIEEAATGRKTAKDALADGRVMVQRELDAVFDAEKYPLVDLGLVVTVSAIAAILAALGIFYGYTRKRLGKIARHEARWAYFFVAPWVLGFLVFTLGPMLASLFFSFTQYNVLSPPRWVGLANYSDLLSAEADGERVSKAFQNVLYLAGYGVPLGLFTGLAVALLLNQAVRGMRFYRTLFYLPAIVPTVASAILWMWVLTPDPSKGLMNAFWRDTIGIWFNLPAPGWLNAEAWAKPSLIAMGLWGAGSGMILWLAGLKGIPSQLYEAAAIDGASPKRQFWAITIPQLSPIIFFNLVIGFITALQEFDRIYIMRPPSDGSVGPGDSLLMPVFLLFKNAFEYFKMGSASALAWLLFTIILALTLFQFLLAKRWVHYEADK